MMQRSLLDFIEKKEDDVDCETIFDMCDGALHNYMNMDYPGWPVIPEPIACEIEYEYCSPRGD